MIDAALYRQAFEEAHDAFIVLDAGGAITAWSVAAERLYGYTAAEVTGRTLDFLRIAGEQTAPTLLAGGPRERLVRQRHKSGRELQVSLRIAAAGGQPGLLLCAADVSRWRQTEAELAGSRTALEASREELRRVIGRLVAAEEEARRRISQELHDDLCQRLAALALGLKAVRRQLPEGDTRRIELDALGGDLGDAAEDLRRLSHDLHPAILERRGLAAALRDHCEEVERRCSLPVRLTLRGTAVSLPPPLVLGLYRIAQEALANAVRHAGARDVHVTLEIEDGAVFLAVVDDGAGFEPDEVRRTGGLGLAGIEERARLLGGRCRIASATGAGTEVRVSVPRPAPPPAAPAGVEDRRPPQIGPYLLLETIGTGSTATVYLAQEPEPLGRRVAIKLHRAPLPGRWATVRFRAEQQALARLHHPAIAQVYEARMTEDDDLYIAMEYVPGLPITDYCDRYGLSLRKRLELFAAVCDGVQHAHQKGVLHRDLKPSHILIAEATMVGIRPNPKIIDFGAAKGLDRPLTESTVWGAEGLVGTPAYLPPEALAGGETDARSDVYSLGVVLYELLAGTVPFAAGEPGVAGIAGRVEAVRRGDPVPPSQRLRTLDDAAEVARRRGFDEPSKLRRRLIGDLDRLVLKALAADPADRYPTVEALGREIGRVVRGAPVEAGPPGALHQLRRLLRRNRRLVAPAALVILALAGGLAATLFEARQAAREAARADAAALFLENLFKASDPRQAKGTMPSARELLARGTDRLSHELRDQPLLRARLLDTLGGIHTSLGLFAEARPLLAEALAIRERLRGPEHPEVAETLVRLGALARLSGQGDAVPLFRRALAIREARLGPGSPEVAEVLNDLGTALAAQGRFDEAEATLGRTLALQDRLWGDRDPRVAKTLHNLGGIAYYRGRPADAERLLGRAVAIRETALAPDDPDLAGSLEALALLRQQQGRPAEALQLLERQVPIVEKVYGPGHPELARALLNLGLVRKDLGEDAAARQLFERALAIQEKTVAPVHPEHVRALAALADLHFERGRYAEAEPLFRRLLKLRDQGASYDQWDKSLANWARLLRATGRGDEASQVEVRAAPR
jgi:PAS domain S-box-containing protein